MMGREYLEEIGYHAYLQEAKSTLKHCPLCGGKPMYNASIHIGYDYETGSIRCPECGVELHGVHLYGYGMYDPLKSFEKWNRRVGDIDEVR